MARGANSSSRWFVLAALGVVALAVLVYWFRFRHAAPPRKIVLSVCRDPGAGLERIRGDFAIRLDVPEEDFVVRTAPRDMPPGEILVVTRKDRDESMLVWHDDDVFSDLKRGIPLMSHRTGAAEVRNWVGRVGGRDSWGDFNDGERWRYVVFATGDAVGYRPVPIQDARQFDEILSSACIPKL